MKRHTNLLCLGAAVALLNACAPVVNAPEPVLPVPEKKQVDWQKMETYAFVHFGLNTFNDREWGYGDSDPATFNPVKLDCEQWVQTFVNSGMKGVILTAKHHDGFCMFDSQYTDFSISRCAFKEHPKADVAKYVFEAFRKEGFMTGAYFSKPDWHNQDYWWDYFATPNRNVNYKIERHPEKWEAFKTYTHNQIGELMSNYGTIDILWLDGGWVSPRNNQDIDMPQIAAMARAKQPGLLVVDRTIHGKYENYQTPEQKIPEHQLPYPWESCVTLTTDWGWVKNPVYKTPNRIISILMEVVAKGGNLLLGVGPTAEGLIEQPTVKRLQEIGRWMQKNGKAIYHTRITPNYHCGNVWFTADKNGRTLYALYALPEGETLPAVIEWGGDVPERGTSVRLLSTGQRMKWIERDGKVAVTLPAKLAGSTEPIALQFDTPLPKQNKK
mgnify:CR=1 FL=1